MKTKKEVEKRVYVVVPRHITTPDDNYIKMECGRLMAQVAHVVSRLKLKLKLDPEEEHTTIILQVPDDRALAAMKSRVVKGNVPWAEFRDTNVEFYKTEDSFLTGVAVYCSKKKGKSLFYSLDTWKCQLER